MNSSQAVSKTKHFLNWHQCSSLLHHYATTKSLSKTKQLHAHTITSGLLSPDYPAHLVSLLTTTYATCGQVSYARKLFDELPQRTLYSYDRMIRLYTNNGLSRNALQLFIEMLDTGHCLPNKYTYTFVIKACGDLSLLELGGSIHGLAITSGVHSDTFVANSLLAMYMSCGKKERAKMVFDTMWERGVVSWNTMISGYIKNGCADEALIIFNKMVDAGVEPDCATVVSVLPACGILKDLKFGREVHKLVEEKGLGFKIPARNALVDMYAKCGNMNNARSVFDKMKERDVVTWTALINGYILNGDVRSALVLCPLMQLERVSPNSVTVASLLSACASLNHLKHGRCLHGWAIRRKLEADVIVETALIDLYAKCNCIELSFRVFTKTSRKRTVPWNAILSGCIYNGLTKKAVELFKQLLFEAVEPNLATLKCLLPAYAILADLQLAMNVHCYLIKSGFISIVDVATGLMDIYSKCGGLEVAHEIFNGIPVKDKDIILWSAILAGYGKHGHGEVAVSLFNRMVQSGVKPNDVTFTSVLHACSHAGLVDEGVNLFNYMLKVHKMSPCADHYTCLVDLLGRAGRLEEAYELINTMPFKANHAIWGALLGACVKHENIELGEVAAKCLFELEPENTGNYVLLAKIYAAAGRWKDAENVRHVMNEIGLIKAPAHSLIEVRNT
ncbi:pentatricopeptide repeat-containing protein At5g39350 [Cornus florida]|uniref:pentatricopeptide repeat-containing protein At5g39350 n=1 Tax=Cornus florida TaxID=4283 RepID=UPI00289E38BF|nr:pentatricopeptide repeat-containing protein At5g39350 [Cornus florida]